MHQNPWLVNLFVPIGISFHTFQSISYLVDVYRGRMIAIRKPLDYALYLAFFPQLLGGPIVRAGLFFGELFSWRPPGPETSRYGLARAGFGLVKKMAIADQFAGVANAYFDSDREPSGMRPPRGARCLRSACRSISISRATATSRSAARDCSDSSSRKTSACRISPRASPISGIAGTSRSRPGCATISTFRWAASRDGSARHAAQPDAHHAAGRLWHGAQWTFVAWGGFHGVMLCIERLFGVGHERAAPRGVVLAVRVVLTFAVVTLAWVLFRAPSFADALAVYRAMFAGGPGAELLTGWQAVLAAGIVVFAAFYSSARTLRNFEPTWPQLRPALQVGTLAGLAFSAAALLVVWAVRRHLSTLSFSPK